MTKRGKYRLERVDEEDGSFTYEVWDGNRRMFSLNEEEAATRGDAKRDAERIVIALNTTAD